MNTGKRSSTIEAMKQALYCVEAWERGCERDAYWRDIDECITALRTAIEAAESQQPVAFDGDTSDGYHTFNELYEFRKAYNAALFNEWAAGGKCSVHKSWRHHDGELCFGGGWFIVVAVLPEGQISNHYEAKDWGLFAIPETERALFEFDGHTGVDVVARLKAYTTPPAPMPDPLHLSRILHELAGAASMCWTPAPTGVFDSQEAIKHVTAAIEEIRARSNT